MVISSSPAQGGRRARLAAERQEREAQSQGPEVLESGAPRRAQNRPAPAEPLQFDDFPATGSILLADYPDRPAPVPHAPVQYAPMQYAPDHYAPSHPAPGPYAPGQFAPGPNGAGQFAPGPNGTGQFAPGPNAAVQYAPGPNGAGPYAGPNGAGPYAPGPYSPEAYAPGRYDDAPTTSSLPRVAFPVPAATGPTTTELDLTRGRRAARPQTSRRRAELALGRSVSNRRVWGAVLGVVMVLAVPGASMLQSSVTVADGGLSGSANLATDSPDSNRVAQPDAAEISEASATDRARAKAKATALAVATAAEKAAAEATADAKNQPKKNSTKTPSAGSTGRLNTQLSGLSWVSGVYSRGQGPAGVKAFGDWRGSAVDVVVDWGARQSWDDIINPTFLYSTWKDTPYTKVIGIAPVPEADDSATMAGCAAGSYNDKWRQFGTNMQNAGLANETVIRLGWEMNGDWYKWQASDPGQFAECWRQIVSSAEQTAPGLLWDWTVIRGKGKSVEDARQAYPGDAYVDIVGVDAYDMWPGATNASTWAEQYSGAYGLKFWSDFAKDHGKRISVPEWGVYPTAGSNGGDNAFYIEKMQGFFKAEGSHLAYEAYFNESAAYISAALFNPTQNPVAAAKYQALFGS